MSNDKTIDLSIVISRPVTAKMSYVLTSLHVI